MVATLEFSKVESFSEFKST